VCEEVESGWLDTGYEEAENIWGDKTGKLRDWMLSNVVAHMRFFVPPELN
jgi:hypothetical protein